MKIKLRILCHLLRSHLLFIVFPVKLWECKKKLHYLFATQFNADSSGNDSGNTMKMLWNFYLNLLQRAPLYIYGRSSVGLFRFGCKPETNRFIVFYLPFHHFHSLIISFSWNLLLCFSFMSFLRLFVSCFSVSLINIYTERYRNKKNEVKVNERKNKWSRQPRLCLIYFSKKVYN